MALFTGKGDGGDTGLFGCDQRMSKSSAIAEALGTLDELNSFLGLCKARADFLEVFVADRSVRDILHDVQHTLFMAQAELAGADKTVAKEKVNEAEAVIGAIERELPPIKTFFVPGGTEASALFDVARTLARRAERRVVGVKEEGKVGVGEHTLAYLNRLSSLLYALARHINHKSGITEEPPHY